jgi:hypothetical protein
VNIQSKKLVVFVAGTALVGALIGAYTFRVGPFHDKTTPAASPIDRGPVIATVDGSPIYLAEAKARVEGLLTVHSGGIQSMGKNWQDTLLQSLIDDRILQEAAGTLGVTVSDQDVAGELTKIEQMFQTAQGFQQWLASQHMSSSELERRITMQLLAARVYAEVTADATVSGSEVRDYYRAHREQYVAADGTISTFLEVRDSVRAALLKKAQNRTYGAWLEQQRQEVKVIVVDDNWWRNIA